MLTHCHAHGPFLSETCITVPPLKFSSDATESFHLNTYLATLDCQCIHKACIGTVLSGLLCPGEIVVIIGLHNTQK